MVPPTHSTNSSGATSSVPPEVFDNEGLKFCLLLESIQSSVYTSSVGEAASSVISKEDFTKVSKYFMGKIALIMADSDRRDRKHATTPPPAESLSDLPMASKFLVTDTLMPGCLST